MITNAIGAQFRRFENREHEGKPARVVVAVRNYDTDRDDLWDALTNPERIPRWFLPIEGDLKLGGHYQLKGNAGGTITRCEAPSALDVTWEFGGGMSWVTVRLDSIRAGTQLTLEHIVLASDVDQHWARFGPGAVGVGWDLTLHGLGLHLGHRRTVDHERAHAWMASDDGKAFMRTSAESWAQAHIRGGEDPEVALGMARRTAAFYTGG
ncbi:MAG TPA: SRPBCC family protein [Steroidobacteraceae bacterium]|nr:SRPBCC family protein [Steroidobacteraceae bacterium]